MSTKPKIPEGWKEIILGDVGKVSMCKRVFKEETHPTGEIPFYKISTFGSNADAFISEELFNKYKNKYPYPKKGDILISASGTIGRTVVFDGEKAYFQDSNIVWISNPEDKVLNRFLEYIYKRTKWTSTDGGVISRLYNDNLRSIKLLLPPLSEQSQIVQILNTWDKYLEILDKKIKIKKKIRKGLLQNLLCEKPNNTTFIGKYKIVDLGNLCNIKTGCKNNQDKNEGGEYPFFVRSQIIERINTYSYDEEAILVPGEGNIGKIFHYIKGKFECHQRVYKISDFGTDVYGKYIYYYLVQNFSKQAKMNSVKATVDSLRLPTFQYFKVVLPSIEKQIAISNILTKSDQEIAMLESQRQVLNQQKNYLLNNLITGQIRVPEFASHN